MKLTKVKSKYNDKFVIEVKFMHGDADAYTTENHVCKDEQAFKDTVSKLDKDRPTPPAEGGDDDAYSAWGLDVFGYDDFLPWDTTGYDCYATYRSYKPFYYDENGEKFEVKV
jgi:hypothetical protein